MKKDSNEAVGTVRIMDGFDQSKPDSIDLIHIAECFARIERKCPDLMINDNYYEYESYVRPWNKRKLSNMISDGLRQSDKIIIDNRDGASFRQINRSIRSRLSINAQISEVWIYDGDSVIDIFP